jgi:hypothetical protein
MDIRLSISVSPSPLPSLSPEPLPALAPTSTSMPLPPEGIYSSKEELYTLIQAWAAQHQYAFCIGRSTKIHTGPRIKITYNCERYGLPPPENHPQKYSQARKRQTTTRKTGCRFSIVAIQHTDTEWELRYRPGAEYSIHNHPPSQAISSHPVHRKLTQAEINQARSLYYSGKSKIV